MQNGNRPQESTGHVEPRPKRSRREVGENPEHLLVSKTRPGYKTFSRSFSPEIPSTLFSATEVDVVWAGPEGVDGAPSRLKEEAGVGLGSPRLLAGRVPGDTGLVRVSICGHSVSNRRCTITLPDLCL